VAATVVVTAAATVAVAQAVPVAAVLASRPARTIMQITTQ
jgi:hypothetical protein